MKWVSPAKINLFLQVTGKLENGFHQIATAMQAISLVDFLEIQESTEDSLTCTDPHIPTDEKNLVLQAASLFRKKTGKDVKISCHLEKNIPAEGGLGGGSSNAATTLWAMNELTGRPAVNAQLMQWSAEIGSDIPFFFSLGAAYCTGRGEEVLSFQAPLLQSSVQILTPSFGVSTKKCYQTLMPAEWSAKNPVESLKKLEQGKPCFYNDLEKSAFRVVPELLGVKEELTKSGCPILAGSGSSFWWAAEQGFCSVSRSEDSWYFIS